MTPHLEVLVTGHGDPVTLFAHGLAMSIPDTRPFGSGVAGSRVFVHLRGHGHSVAPPADDAEAWTYPALAADVESVADDEGATRAVGVSLGAGVLLAAAVRAPGRFSRLVLAMPASLDQPRPPEAVAAAEQLADAIDAGDHTSIVRLLTALQPPAVRGRADLRLWARRHADWLARSTVSRALRRLPREVPVTEPAALAGVDAPVLVLAQTDDPVHPLAVAEQVAGLLPRAELVVSEVPWLWGGRDRLREVVGGFLDPVAR